VKAPVLASALSLLSLACGHIAAYNAELAAADAAAAERPKPAPRRTEAARPLHVRAYADADYRAEHANWRADIEEIFEVTNLLVQPQLDTSLRLDGSREWDRHCDLNDRDSCLTELAQLDPGAPDVWVVAFTGSLTQLSRDLDALGHSQPLGRHILLRGMGKLDEADDFELDAGELPSAERRAIADEHRRHKGAVALMHAWAHSLGSLHGGDAVSIMSPSYRPEQAEFSGDATELLGFMIDARLSGSPEIASEPMRAAYRLWLEEHPASFTAEERQRRLAELSSGAGAHVVD
jgi:hypothetical protein